MSGPAAAADAGAARPVRDAATLILVRRRGPEPEVLMGQRGASAAFMPSAFVFPGGRVDAADAAVPLARPLPDAAVRLLTPPDSPAPAALAAAAIRELWEETGLRLACPAADYAARPEWADFCAGGWAPDAGALSVVFRAITPPGRPRRFDARFFLAEATALADDPDDFTRAGDELSQLQWLTLAAARELPTPFITRVVLGEVAARLADPAAPRTVPFFDNSGPVSRFRALGAGA